MKKTIFFILLLSAAHFTSVQAFAYTFKEDPYQNVKNDTALKRHYLNRIANAPVGPNDPPFEFRKDERFKRHQYEYIHWEQDPRTGVWEPRGMVGNNVNPSYPMKWGETPYYNPDTSTHSQGAVYITDDANDLGPLFEKVAKKIKTRLVK